MRNRNAAFQSSARTPKTFASLSFEIRELAGRFAGVGYAKARIGLTTGFFARSASSKIASAKPCHDVAPPAVMPPERCAHYPV